MPKKIHICLLASGLVFDHPYGEEKFTTSLADWLTLHGYNITLIGRAGLLKTKYKHLFKNDPQNQNKNNIAEKAAHSIGPRYLAYALRPLISILFIFQMLSINRKYPIDLIHAQDIGYGGLAAIVLSKLIRKPTIISSHGIRHEILESNAPSIFKKLGFIKFEYNLDIFNVNHADKVIAVSPHIKSYFESKTGKNIDFFPIPINVAEFSYSELNRKSIRSELKLDQKIMIIGYIGRLTEEKNLITLLLSFKGIADQDSFLKLVLVGDGPIKDKLRTIVKENNIEDRVIFCGLRHDIARVLCGIDIFVLPSYTEGWSTALLESMACGRTIVCSDIESNRGLVTHNKEALLANPYKQSDFVQSFKLLCDDDLLRAKLGINAKNKAMLYDKEIIFPKIDNYYKMLVKEKLK